MMLMNRKVTASKAVNLLKLSSAHGSSKWLVVISLALLFIWLCEASSDSSSAGAGAAADQMMPTFREYREKVIALAQSAKGAAAAKAAADAAAATEAAVGSGGAGGNGASSAGGAAAVSMESAALKKNVASQECGARALAWNPEAKDVDAILTDNRDIYMKNLCSARKWLELQLCEPVQLRRLELANFELFSSAFKNVSVLASDSHPPAREWLQVANLTLNASRTWQRFDLRTEQFVQYVRLSFSEHWGSEHYCTLTHLRLHGLLAADLVDSDPDDPWSEDHHYGFGFGGGGVHGDAGGATPADAAAAAAAAATVAGIGVAGVDARDSACGGNASASAACPAVCAFLRLLPPPSPSLLPPQLSSSSSSLPASMSSPKLQHPSGGSLPDSVAHPGGGGVGGVSNGTESTVSAAAAGDTASANAAAAVPQPPSPPAAPSSSSSAPSPTSPQSSSSGSASPSPPEASERPSQPPPLPPPASQSSAAPASSASTPAGVGVAAPVPPAPPAAVNGGGGSGGGSGVGGIALLGSRMKDLERNVSVSMRYLEELSLAYNRHVQRLSQHLNVTLSRLQEKARVAARRDRTQSGRIRALERRLETGSFAVVVAHAVFLALHTALIVACWRRR